jgi:hypothetical protein
MLLSSDLNKYLPYLILRFMLYGGLVIVKSILSSSNSFKSSKQFPCFIILPFLWKGAYAPKQPLKLQLSNCGCLPPSLLSFVQKNIHHYLNNFLGFTLAKTFLVLLSKLKGRKFLLVHHILVLFNLP